MSAAQLPNASTTKGCIQIELEELDEWGAAMLKKRRGNGKTIGKV
jgi:hypothetical protein